MQLYHPRYTRNGQSHSASKWYLRLTDHQGEHRVLALFEDRELSESAAQAIIKLCSYRAAGRDFSSELHAFFHSTTPYIRRKLFQWQIVDASYGAAFEPIADCLEQWSTFLVSKGSTKSYVLQKVGRTKRLFHACGFRFWRDIRPDVVSKRLAAWRESTNEAMSHQTSNFYLQGAKQFCRYMIKVQRVGGSCPLDPLDFLNVRSDRRHDRRAFSVDEFQELVNHVSTAPTFWHIPGTERVLVYWFAVETGLRHRAIAGLKVRSFASVDGRGIVRVKAGAKNKYAAERELLIRRDLWQVLQRHFEKKAADDSAFRLPPRTHAAKLLKRDLETARAAWIERASDVSERQHRTESDFLRYQDSQGRFLDFHALRHTRGVWLFQYHKAKNRQVQAQLGLASLAMVDRYTKSFTDTDVELVERGPTFHFGVTRRR